MQIIYEEGNARLIKHSGRYIVQLWIGGISDWEEVVTAVEREEILVDLLQSAVKDDDCIEVNYTHEDDLAHICGDLNVYKVEYWGNRQMPDNQGELLHPTHHVASFSTFDLARGFCENNSDYAGDNNDWHWMVTRIKLNEDPLNTVDPRQDMYHLTRDGRLM